MHANADLITQFFKNKLNFNFLRMVYGMIDGELITIAQEQMVTCRPLISLGFSSRCLSFVFHCSLNDTENRISDSTCFLLILVGFCDIYLGKCETEFRWNYLWLRPGR